MSPSNSNLRIDARILEEAAEWFVELNTDESEPDARVNFDEWLRRSPEHVRAYLSLVPSWEEGRLQPAGPASDLEALIARANAADNVVPLPTALSAPRRAAEIEAPLALLPVDRNARSVARWVIAAAIVVACVGIGTMVSLRPGAQMYTTSIGEQRSITLSDGSVMELNARSRVRIRFTKQERAIDLVAGQALFQVQKDPTRAFVVSAGTTVVRAVGTEFDVYRNGDNITVSVLEGRVAVAKTNTSSALLFVSAGEQMTIPEAPVPASTPRPVDATAVRAWTQHRLVFRSTPLAEVVAEFNRYNVRQMVLRDPGLGGLLVSGVFSSTQPAALLRFLSEQPGVTIQESTNEIRVGSK